MNQCEKKNLKILPESGKKLLSMHEVGMRLIHIQTSICNISFKPNLISHNFLIIFYWTKKLQNSIKKKSFFNKTRFT